MKPPASEPHAPDPDEIDPLDLEALHDLLDERLDAAASAALRARLQREPALRASWRELCELRDLLRAEWSDETPTPIDPRALADRVLERAHELAPAALAPRLSGAPAAAPALHRTRWFRVGLSFAAAASVCAAAIWLAMLAQEAAPTASRAEIGERAEIEDRAEKRDRAELAEGGRSEDFASDEFFLGLREASEMPRPAKDPLSFGARPSADDAAPAVESAAEPKGGEADARASTERDGAPGAVPAPGAPVESVAEPEPQAPARSEAAPASEVPGAPAVQSAGMPENPSGAGGGGTGAPEFTKPQSTAGEGEPRLLGWEEAAGDALRLEILRTLRGGLAPTEAAAGAASNDRAGAEVEALQEAVQEGGFAVANEAERGAWLDSTALRLVRQLDRAPADLETAAAGDSSERSESRDDKRFAGSKAKSAEEPERAAAAPWNRLMRSWSTIQPSAELAKERGTPERARSSGRGAAGSPMDIPEAERVLLLQYHGLAPEQLDRARTAFQEKGFVTSAGGLSGLSALSQQSLAFRSVIEPVEATGDAPVIFVGWLETASEAALPKVSFGDAAGSVGSDPQVAQRWVQLGELESAISRAARIEELARRERAAPTAPSGGPVEAGEVALKNTDGSRPAAPTSGGPGGDSGRRGGVALSRDADVAAREPGAKKGELEAKKGADDKVGPAGTSGPGAAAPRLPGAVLGGGAQSDPARPGSPPAPRAVRVLAILEPKRGG